MVRLPAHEKTRDYPDLSPPAVEPEPSAFAHDGVFWRRLARLGATRGPEWWVRYGPPLFGVAGLFAVPSARRAVLANLQRVRGPRPPLRDAMDVVATFVNYASCLAEVLSNGSKNARTPHAAVYGERHLRDAAARGRGVILVTAHTGGWEIAGPLMCRDQHCRFVMVMSPERDRAARAVHDAARSASGLVVAHVGDDPLASLTLLRYLRERAVIALQVDRLPPHLRARRVRLFDAMGAIPEGPLRLAQVSGAPVVPVFCARESYRQYIVEAHEPILLGRHATENTIDAAAQRIADAMTAFLKAHPTQWFHFSADPDETATAGRT